MTPSLRCLSPFRLGPLRNGAARKAAAFTLLELLLSLSVAALVAVTLLTSLSVAFRARRGAQQGLEPSRHAGLALQVLRDDLESALPPRGTLASTFYSNDLVDDRGLDSDELVFSAATPGPLHVTGTGDVKRLVYAVMTMTGTGQRVLVRRVYGNLLSPVLVEPDDEVLCRNVGSFNVRFFDGTFWWDSWDGAFEGNEVPVAVEVTLELEPTRTSATAGAAAAEAPWPRFVRVIPLSCAGQGEADEESGAAGSGEGDGSAGQGQGQGPGQGQGGNPGANPGGPNQGPQNPARGRQGGRR